MAAQSIGICNLCGAHKNRNVMQRHLADGERAGLNAWYRISDRRVMGAEVFRR